MTTHTYIKRNNKVKNVKRGAYIKYIMTLNGIKVSDIANDLSISNVAVYRSINGLSTISRVDEWLRNNLGLEGFND